MVSSWSSTVPSAACSASSAKAGVRRAAACSTTARGVTAGNGKARAFSSRIRVEWQTAAVREERAPRRGSFNQAFDRRAPAIAKNEQGGAEGVKGSSASH